ncbi:MAG: 3-hydroxyacyl-ACP dehydratase FabZ [Gammaproteobacteria bacterium]|nr:3-hydroxyacyl-ACP dehydratase FabZ [Gammaproteobacteria bacterium]MDH4313563.1 3-hydroxyacyl-ACP dehydratase FabZ [Gammaproteobacteria bacterium]MDH5212632.1 3-hydroxyacyl-ACP dehydratase FabZ [Gammaproteobacteria bacterium]MDH5501189.1 3-hydroxyacyl-ACP dehydratase FabZ [Gammaproteobacteria bacterium]
MSTDNGAMDITAIMDLLPHRYPFLLIDKVVECRPRESITAIKNVTANEPFFQGHFPGSPVMPGVLMLEVMAQACCVLCYRSLDENALRPLYFLAGVDEARFRRPVRPGDTLRVRIDVEKEKKGIWRFDCAGTVDGHKVASAKIMCAPGGEL